MKWRGCPSSENTWEPPESLAGCRQMLAAFKRAQNATKKGGSKKDPKAKKAPGRAKQAGGKASPRVKSTRSGGHTSNGGSTVPVATDAPVSHFEQIPPEVLLKVLSLLDGKTLMVSVPQVCHRWRAACAAIRNVHLDFSWWGGGIFRLRCLRGGGRPGA